MIKPLLNDMTKSEIHAVMTGGFATIAGSVLATYILFGVRNSIIVHLILPMYVSIDCSLISIDSLCTASKRGQLLIWQ